MDSFCSCDQGREPESYVGLQGNSATLFKYNVVLVVFGDLNYTLNGAAATKTITVTSADTAEFEFEVDSSTLVSLASSEIVSEKVNSGSISSAYASWALTAPAADESISVTLSFTSSDGTFDYFVKVIASGGSAGSKSNYVLQPSDITFTGSEDTVKTVSPSAKSWGSISLTRQLT